MGNIDNFMSIFNVIIGAYCIYAAIAGKGAAYKNDYPEEIKEPAKKSMRILLAVVGPIALALGALDYFIGKQEQFHQLNLILQYVGIGIELAIIIAYIVWFRVKYGKKLKNPKIKKVQ